MYAALLLGWSFQREAQIDCLDESAALCFIAGQCDAEKARQVDEHLDGCSHCLKLLAQMARTSLAHTVERDRSPGATPSSDGPRAWLPRGAAVGRYTVLDWLGSGGMGVVYAAYDPKLDRRVALKLIRPGASGQPADADYKGRLLREAKAMARISHPDVIAVHDVDTFGDQVVLSMEYVEGTTPRQWLLEKPRSFREVLELYLRAGRGLAAAHAAGIVHRDFKPDNVLVGRDGRVRVTDFGLARLSTSAERPAAATLRRDAPAEAPVQDASLTRTGTRLGSPAYMAPEQMRGELADARSDLFSFCVALYEGLYGERPFPGRNLEEIAASIERGEVREPPPGTAVPARVRRALLKGLRSSPAERPGSMEELLAELSRDPAGVRKRALAAASALAAIALALFGVRWFAQRQSLVCKGAERKLAGIWDGPRKQAIRAAFAATGASYAEHVWRGVERELDSYGAAWTAMHTSACEATRLRGEQSEELLDLRMECLGRRLRDLDALGSVLSQADIRVVENAGQAAGNLPSLDACANEQELRSRIRLPTDLERRARIEQARAGVSRARALSSTGKPPREGLALAVPAVQQARALGYKPLLADALAVLGDLQEYAGDYKMAESTLREAALAAEASGDDELLAETRNLLIKVYYRTRQFDRAHEVADLAAATIQRMGGSERLEATRLIGLGALLANENRLEEALLHLKKALALRERVSGVSSHAVAKTLTKIGALYLDMHRFGEALDHTKRALAIVEKEFGPDHTSMGYCFVVIGNALRLQHRVEEGLDWLHRARAVYEKILPPGHLSLAELLEDIGAALDELGRAAEALAYHRRALAIHEKSLGPDDPRCASALTGMGMSLRALKRPKEAVALLERALRLRGTSDLPAHDLAGTRFALARALRDAKGDRRRAVRLALQARDGYAREKEPDPRALADVKAWLSRNAVGIEGAAPTKAAGLGPR